MAHFSGGWRHPMVLAGLLLLAGCVLAGKDTSARTETSAHAPTGPSASGGTTPSTGTAAERGTVSTRPDSLRPKDLIQPEELARLVAAPAASRPHILQIGFHALYGTAHIPGSQYVGAASQPEGLRALTVVLRPLPRRQALVLRRLVARQHEPAVAVAALHEGLLAHLQPHPRMAQGAADAAARMEEAR